jgi:hypothetical protein
MDKLKEKIFDFILKRQAARKVSMPRWEDVRTVAVLYPDNNIPHIIKQIEKDSKEVILFSMPDKKEICWLTERPKSEVRDFICARSFEVLIDLTQAPSRTMQYMAMYMHADFKVGRHTREGIYDMTIDTPPQTSPDYLFEQIMRYIEMFGMK